MGPAHSFSPDHASNLRLPQRIGRYNVMGRLAIGGMAEILLARLVGPAGFERPVVIKRVLQQFVAQPRFVHMFLDEARIAASIRHRNVVHVEDLGHDEHELYLIMEYLEGETIAGLLRRLVSRAMQLPPDICAYIIAEACAGLHAAHERDVVHRDVSPQNIFIGYDGSIKVLDFGIAKATDRITSTEAGELKGKFAYMSPEQCLATTLGPRSDIFSLGIVLYEMLTLHRLFQRDTRLATLQAVVDDEIPTPRATRPQVRALLANSCLKALERDPEERYESALTFKQDLQQSTISSEGLPEQRLSQLMTELFSERLAQKQEMLRQFRSGEELTEIPHAEADVDIELPSVVIDARVSPRQDSSVPRFRMWWLPLFLVVALLVGTLAWWLWGPHGVEPAPEPTSPRAEGAPPPPVPTKTVRIEVESSPPGATVWLDQTQLDVTPAVFWLERGDVPLKLRLTLEDHQEALEQVTPDIDQRLRVSLLPNQQKPPPRRRKNRQTKSRQTPEKEIRMFP